VTAGETLSAVLILDETDRQVPFGERHRVAYMLGVVGGMGVVACPAGPPLYRLVDMDEMEVLVAVPEAGQGRGPLHARQRLFVAHEAELVIVRVVRGIEERRKILLQNPEVFGAMGIVAAGAVMLSDGPMPVLVVRQELLHIHDVTGLAGVLPVVAAHAEIRRLHGGISSAFRVPCA